MKLNKCKFVINSMFCLTIINPTLLICHNYFKNIFSDPTPDPQETLILQTFLNNCIDKICLKNEAYIHIDAAFLQAACAYDAAGGLLPEALTKLHFKQGMHP